MGATIQYVGSDQLISRFQGSRAILSLMLRALEGTSAVYIKDKIARDP